MHRVLSLQMARGFGETSEYVTKRMCFSLVLSTGFLCILGGFLLGRYAIERTLKMRADRAHLEFADNGLRSSNHLQSLLLQILEQTTFDDNYISTDVVQMDDSIHGIKGILKKFTFFSKIVETTTCTIATARGLREPDKYVVFSVSGDGIGLAIELASALNQMYLEQSWRPRRSIIFCMFLGSNDFCKKELPIYVQTDVIAYIAVHGNAVQDKGYLVVSGSDMMQQMIYQSTIKIQFSSIHLGRLIDNSTLFGQGNNLPRLAVNMPHAVLSFVPDNDRSKMYDEIPLEKYRKVLAQIVGVSIWRLSESIVLRWDPSYFNHSVIKALDSIDSTEFKDQKDKLFLTIQETVKDINKLNAKLDAIEKSKCLEVRMSNDLIVKLDQALLCPDRDLHSKTDLVIFSILPHESASVIASHLNELAVCYAAADELLRNA